MIFTPGDIVYSSTSLLKLSEPKIENYKILDLMEENNISFEKLLKIYLNLKTKKCMYLEHLIIDTYKKWRL